MNTCLIVIDAQESFKHRPYFPSGNYARYLDAQNQLIHGAIRKAIPIIRILHSDGPALKDNPFAMESGHVVPLKELAHFDAAATFVKHKHSALVGTGLEPWLREHGVEALIISGIRTEQCCETTTRHASDLGWQVDYVLEATLSFEMQLPDGRSFPEDDIKARTASVLKDRFARICTVTEALTLGTP